MPIFLDSAPLDQWPRISHDLGLIDRMRAAESTSKLRPSLSRWTLWSLVTVLLTEVVAVTLLLSGVTLLMTVVSVVLAVVAIAVGVAAIAFLARGRFQYRLSTFLLLTAIVAGGLGVITSHTINVRRQSAAVLALRQYDCEVTYEPLPLPKVIQPLRLDVLFSRVREVHLTSPPATTDERIEKVAKELRSLPYQFRLSMFTDSDCSDSALGHLGDVRTLSGIRIGGVNPQGKSLSSQITDEALNQLRKVPLESISAVGTSITFKGLSELEHPESLLRLGLDNTKVSDEHSSVLTSFEHLEELSLQNTDVSDAVTVHIAKLQRLRRLFVNLTNVTDAGLGNFKHLKHLQELGLGGLRLTDEAVEDLQSALPDCEIFHF